MKMENNDQLIKAVQTQQAASTDEIFKAPMHTYGSHAIMMLTNPSDDLFMLECELRGLKPDSNNNPQPVAEPLINKDGAHKVIGLLRARAHKIQIMGHISEQSKSKEIVSMGEVLIQELMINKNEFDVKSDVDRSYVVQLATSYYESILDSSLNGGNRDFWGKQRVETTAQQTPQVSTGILNKLNPFK